MVKIDDLFQIKKYVIRHKDTEVLMFGERMFDRSNHAKAAFRQNTKTHLNGYSGISLDDQNEYELVEVLYTMEENFSE